jgi:hypothetical protein
VHEALSAVNLQRQLLDRERQLHELKSKVATLDRELVRMDDYVVRTHCTGFTVTGTIVQILTAEELLGQRTSMWCVLTFLALLVYKSTNADS